MLQTHNFINMKQSCVGATAAAGAHSSDGIQFIYQIKLRVLLCVVGAAAAAGARTRSRRRQLFWPEAVWALLLRQGHTVQTAGFPADKPGTMWQQNCTDTEPVDYDYGYFYLECWVFYGQSGKPQRPSPDYSLNAPFTSGAPCNQL